MTSSSGGSSMVRSTTGSAAKVSGVVRDALAALPVVDLTIEEPPLEEVMRELFLAGQKDPRDGARAHG